MRLIVFYLNLFFLAGSVARADQLQLNFSADSLNRSDNEYHYSYPNTQILTVNPLLSLPVKTLYLDASLDISELAINVESTNPINIGTISENDANFSDAITSIQNGQMMSLLHKRSNLEKSLYHKQIMSRDGHRYLAVSILPVTIDSYNNIILNSSITITTNLSGRRRARSRSLGQGAFRRRLGRVHAQRQSGR